MIRKLILQTIQSTSARYLAEFLYFRYRTYSILLLDAHRLAIYLKKGDIAEYMGSIDLKKEPEIDSFASIALLKRVLSIGGPVILRLGPHLAFKITEYLPKVTQRDLKKILTHRIEIISPFSAEQILLHIFNVRPDHHNMIKVDLLIIPKYVIDRARMLVDKIGVKPDIIDVAGEAKLDRPTFNLLYFYNLPLKQKLLKIGIHSGLIVLIGLSLVYFLEAIQLRNLSKEAIFQAVERSAAISDWADLQREMTRLRKNGEAISARFVNSSSPLIILEILSQEIPNNSFLTYISINNDEIAVSGLSEDPVALVIALDDLPMFHNVRLINQPERLSKGTDGISSLFMEHFSLALSFDERAVNQ